MTIFMLSVLQSIQLAKCMLLYDVTRIHVPLVNLFLAISPGVHANRRLLSWILINLYYIDDHHPYM